MKNYYEILEIDKNASPEIVDKAYKTLVKKYHPDLQTSQEVKNKCEEKIKEINEAYDTISNTQLRAEYDDKLSQENNIQKEEKNIVDETKPTQNNNSSVSKENYEQKMREELKRQEEFNRHRKEQEQERQRQYQDAVNKAYHDAYIQDLKNRGYKIKYKKTLNDYLRSAIALLIAIGIIALILQLPFVKDYFYHLYLDNPVIKSFVDTLVH